MLGYIISDKNELMLKIMKLKVLIFYIKQI